MKISKLIKELEIFNGDDEVFLSTDEEGNTIKEIQEVAQLLADDEQETDRIVIWPNGKIVA